MHWLFGRSPHEEQDSGEIADLQQDRADQRLNERRPERLRNHVGRDRKYQQHTDKAAEKEQKGHLYRVVPTARGSGSKIMRKFLRNVRPL